MGCGPYESVPTGIVGNRFRRRRVRLPMQPDQYCHGCDCTPNPVIEMPSLFPRTATVRKSANYTIVDADSGTLFICTAAVAFSLPAPAIDLAFSFFQIANNNMRFEGSGNIYGAGAQAVDECVFQTSGEKVGSACSIVAAEVDNGVWAWLVFQHGHNTLDFL